MRVNLTNGETTVIVPAEVISIEYERTGRDVYYIESRIELVDGTTYIAALTSDQADELHAEVYGD